MPGIIDLNKLLKSLSPEIRPHDFVFCTFDEPVGDFQQYNPIATFREKEGLTLVVTRPTAEKHQLKYDGIFRQITLNVHSSLEAVGLTAAVAARLAELNISANVIAAYHHDHVFVPAPDAEAALSALVELSDNVGLRR